MKVLGALVLCAFAAVSASEDASLHENTAFGYLTRFGIPEAERIRKAEELQARDPSRIVGGWAAAEGANPWAMGLIADLIGIDGQAVCGAVMLTPERAATAAHCWNDGQVQAWQFTVIAGTRTLFSGGLRFTTSAVIPHELWNAALAQNDIAMIIFPAVTLTATISPVTLPYGALLDENFSNNVATAAGFGLTSDSQTGIPTDQVLSEVNLVVISNVLCRTAYPLLIRDSHICTSGEGGSSTCRGDSGGPLTIFRNGLHILIGITSFGSVQGCETGRPAAFTRVTSFNEWMRRLL